MHRNEVVYPGIASVAIGVPAERLGAQPTLVLDARMVF